mmetsp:Transcript_98268/g.233877  ORF Transcript_98268/g.233877 Transcript_98268/m.233877 type:complete len:201 (-) Transcript_98268:687-1289(-)
MKGTLKPMQVKGVNQWAAVHLKDQSAGGSHCAKEGRHRGEPLQRHSVVHAQRRTWMQERCLGPCHWRLWPMAHTRSSLRSWRHARWDRLTEPAGSCKTSTMAITGHGTRSAPRPSMAWKSTREASSCSRRVGPKAGRRAARSLAESRQPSAHHSAAHRLRAWTAPTRLPTAGVGCVQIYCRRSLALVSMSRWRSAPMRTT